MDKGQDSWRPNSAYAVALSDRDLAKLGLLAQLEAQCKAALTLALKPLKRLDTAEWRRLEQRQFKQLVRDLVAESGSADADLNHLARQVEVTNEDILKLRHQNLHSMWASNGAEGNSVAWDLKRDAQLTSERLDGALRQLSDLTHLCAACVMRVGQLICDGKLSEGVGETGPHIKVGGRWVKF